MPDEERIERLELEVEVLRANNKGLKDKIEELNRINMLDNEELECLQEILNEEILSYLQSGYKVTDDYVILCRKILKDLNLKEIYNFEKE